MFHLKLNQIGDTIVEVLIAIAVLGVVLAGAFVTANSSLNGEHTAQEHSQALTIAQGQVEDLFAGDKLVGNCFDPKDATGPVTSGIKCYFDNNENNFCNNNSLALCSVSPPPAPAPAYWYQITDTSSSASLPSVPPTSVTTYEIDVSWPSLTNGTSHVQLYYRAQ
jgi:type II secretory pathway pseudopilin PulG